MSTFRRLLLLLFVAATALATGKSLRVKRGLTELAKIIECSTNRNAIDYVTYGCFCGQGGRGTPKDNTDYCCFRHDCCYGDVEKLGCKTKSIQYHWRCDNGTPECEAFDDSCERQVCECDRKLGNCLKDATYIESNRFWPDAFCGHDELMCN